MIDADRFYSAQEFAGFLGVHFRTIYQSQPHLRSSKMGIHVPAGIRIGRRVRWSGAQILEFQRTLAAMSGIVGSASPLNETLQSRPRRGRPRLSEKSSTKGAV